MPLHPKVSFSHCFSEEEGTDTLLQFVELQLSSSFALFPSTLEKYIFTTSFSCDLCSRNVQTPWISPPKSLNVLTPRLAFCQTQSITNCSSITCFELWVLCGAGIPVFRYMSPGFRARKSSCGRSYYLEVILLNGPGRNQPAELPAGRSIHWGNMMFKSILLPACEKFSNIHCQAVLGGCWKHALSGTAWHQLYGCLQIVSQVVLCGFSPTAR